MERIKKKVLEKIEKSKTEQIKFLKRLVSTRSVNPYMKDPAKSSPREPVELKAAELIFNKLKEIGLSPKFEGLSPLRPNVVCQFGKKGKTLIFNGHLDTVPPAQGCRVKPFSAVIKAGKLYGVGSLDMKASLCCYLFMAKALLPYKNHLKGKISLQFVIDEEPLAASPFGTKYLLERGYLGDAAIIGEPGSHKITIGNKGGYRFELEVFGSPVHTGRLAGMGGEKRGLECDIGNGKSNQGPGEFSLS